MARRAGAPGAKKERAWRHGGSGLRAWRRLGRSQCAWRHLMLFFSALGAILGLESILSVDTFAPPAPFGSRWRSAPASIIVYKVYKVF